MSWHGQVMAYGAPPPTQTAEDLLKAVERAKREPGLMAPPAAARGVPWPDPAIDIGAQRQTVSAWWDGKTLRVKVTLDGHVIAEGEAEGSQIAVTVPR